MRFRYSAEDNGNLVKKAAVYTQDEHRINFSDVDPLAVYIIERLQANGYETYVVGGAVRDLILGKKPKDFDIVTAASPAKIKGIFRNARIIGRRFRLVHVFFGPKIFEVSTFRSLKDGPTSNTFGTIEEDVLRRDFSLNSLFYDPLKQLVVDYVGGMKDIKKRLIRPIIPLPSIFTDDPVRMIRAVKYGAVADFKLPFFLRMKIRKQSALLSGISPSRLTEEILKIIQSPHARQIIERLDELGLYNYLQPRAEELFKTTPDFKAKYLKSIGALNGETFKNQPGEKLSALVRDYLEDRADWDGTQPPPSVDVDVVDDNAEKEEGPRPIAERYRSAFRLARQFVLPMNPPRVELDAALKLLFAEHGVPIKRTQFNERRRRPSSLPPPPTGKAFSPKPAADKPSARPDAGEEKKRKRRRKRKSGARRD